jgi:DNA-binding protein YbaB
VWEDEAALDAVEQRVNHWESSLTERAEKTTALSQQLAALTATAHSGDRLVEATVDASGVLLGLRLDEQIRAQAASRTAEQILSTVRTAHEAAVRHASAATVEALGEDDPAGREIVDAYQKRLRRDEFDA